MTAAAADKAAAAVSKHGRTVTFIKLDTTPADNTKPWRGASAPRTSPADTASLKAVFVPPASASKLGLSAARQDALLRVEQVAIVAPGSTSIQKLEEFDELKDFDDSTWKIEFLELLQPSETKILYFVGVKR